MIEVDALLGAFIGALAGIAAGDRANRAAAGRQVDQWDEKRRQRQELWDRERRERWMEHERSAYIGVVSNLIELKTTAELFGVMAQDQALISDQASGARAAAFLSAETALIRCVAELRATVTDDDAIEVATLALLTGFDEWAKPMREAWSALTTEWTKRRSQEVDTAVRLFLTCLGDAHGNLETAMRARLAR